MGFPGASLIKNPSANAGIHRRCGSGKSLGVRNGNPLQLSYVENSMDRGAWRATDHGVTESGMTELT